MCRTTWEAADNRTGIPMNDLRQEGEKKMKKGLSILTAVLLMAGLFLPAFAAAEEISGPSRPAGFVLPIMMNDRETRECFFANGTPITIQEPKADTAGWVHDKEIQKSLGNGFSPRSCGLYDYLSDGIIDMIVLAIG